METCFKVKPSNDFRRLNSYFSRGRCLRYLPCLARRRPLPERGQGDGRGQGNHGWFRSSLSAFGEFAGESAGNKQRAAAHVTAALLEMLS